VSVERRPTGLESGAQITEKQFLRTRTVSDSILSARGFFVNNARPMPEPRYNKRVGKFPCFTANDKVPTCLQFLAAVIWLIRVSAAAIAPKCAKFLSWAPAIIKTSLSLG